MNPCCGGSLQTGTKSIAIFHLVLSIFLIVFGVVGLIQQQKDAVRVTQEERGSPESQVFVISVGVLSCCLAGVLLSGANKRSRTRCMIWFILNVISLIITVLGTVRAIASKEPGSGLALGLNIVQILLQSYFLWVVTAFMNELNQGTTM